MNKKERTFLTTSLEAMPLNDRDMRRFHAQSKVQKADRRILDSFSSFMGTNGQAMFNMLSSLHTSRVASYGFTAEAEAMGYEEYRINEQLDARTCPVCEQMHGKTFKVSDARKLLEIALRVSDPNDLKQLQPWPGQDQASVEALSKMGTQQLVANGWHIPPFHPRCRGLLGRVNATPSTISQAQASQGPYVASAEDFIAMGLHPDSREVSLWNSGVGIAPAEVAARLQGISLEKYLLGLQDTPKNSGVTTFSAKSTINLLMSSIGFGVTSPLSQAVRFIPDLKTLYLSGLELEATADAYTVVKKYMQQFVSVARDASLESVSIAPSSEIGGYAWAKYGFIPTQSEWDALAATLRAKYNKMGLGASLTPATKTVLEYALSSTDPMAIYTLSDLFEQVGGIGIGQLLLSGSSWTGYLYLANPVAMSRFLAYIGGTYA